MSPLRLAAGSYYGTPRQRLDIADVTFVETHYAPGTRLPRHSHDNAYLCLVVDGVFDESDRSRRRTCTPGQLLVRPPGETHADTFGSSGGRCFNIQLGDSWRARIDDLADTERPAPGTHGGEAARLAERLYRRLRSREPVSAMAVEGLVCLLLAELAPRPAAREPSDAMSQAVAVATEFIHEHFHGSISLVAAAVAARTHPTSLARAFRAHHGVTVGTFVRRCRVEWAQSRLRSQRESLADIAQRAGFYDQAHFTRSFRSVVGCTPGEYRRLSQERRRD